MKLKHSLFTRRQFLNTLLGGWLGAFLVSLVYPVLKFIFPPYREPDQITLTFSEYKKMSPNAAKKFAWGAKPGLLKKNQDGSYTAFVAVCTHLDCTVSYIPEKRKFYCACHQGWYDENGKNIAGPPPRPLRRLSLEIKEKELVIKKEPPQKAK